MEYIGDHPTFNTLYINHLSGNNAFCEPGNEEKGIPLESRLHFATITKQSNI